MTVQTNPPGACFATVSLAGTMHCIYVLWQLIFWTKKCRPLHHADSDSFPDTIVPTSGQKGRIGQDISLERGLGKDSTILLVCLFISPFKGVLFLVRRCAVSIESLLCAFAAAIRLARLGTESACSPSVLMQDNRLSCLQISESAKSAAAPPT